MRVLGEDGEFVGVMSLEQGIALAEEKGLDLIEVSPQVQPPVCKIMDYGKYKFEQKKREKALKKKQTIIQVKELTMGPTIEKHDYEVKLKQAIKFLEKGDKVNFTVRFRGRQLAHKEMGEDILNRFSEDLKEMALPEKKPVLEGRRMMVVLAPKKK